MISKDLKKQFFSNLEFILLATVFLLTSSYLIMMKLWMYNNLNIVSDLFFYHQLIINTLDGRFFYEPGSGMHLGVHSYFALFFFMPFTALFKSAAIILVIWSLLFASAVYPIFYIAKHYCPFEAKKLKEIDFKKIVFSFAIVLLYLLLPNHLTLFNDGPYGFHLDLLFFPGIMWLFYFAFVNKKNLFYFITLFLLLSIKEEMAIYTAFFSFCLYLDKDRRKLAVVNFAFSVLYFIGSTQMIAYFASQSFEGTDKLTRNVSIFSAYGDGYLEIAFYILSHPSVFFNFDFVKLFSDSSKDFFYLNLFSPLITLLAIPKLTILTLSAPLRNFPWHYATIYSFIFLGFITSLNNIKFLLFKYGKILTKKIDSYKVNFDSTVLVILIIILWSSVISFKQNFEPYKILIGEKSAFIQATDSEIDEIRKKISPNSTIGISLFLYKYFQNENTSLFSNHPLSISRMKRIDPDVYVVHNSDLDSLISNVIKYFSEEKGYNYELRSYKNFTLIRKI